MLQDHELLRDYASDASEDAFSEFVRRNLDFVYGVARRRVGNDAFLAQEVCQDVFSMAASKAKELVRHPLLKGWLHTATCYSASRAVRTEQRRKTREHRAHIMQKLNDDAEISRQWMEVRPVIDDVIGRLGDRDREAVLLRFFEGLTFPEIGAALQMSEDAARQRTDRALEKIRILLARRGVTSTSVALGTILLSQPAVAAPAGLASLITTSALASAATGVTAGVLSIIGSLSAMSKITVGITGILLATGSTMAVLEVRTNRKLVAEINNTKLDREDERREREKNRQLTESLAKSGSRHPDLAELARLNDTIAQLKARPAAVAGSTMKSVSEYRNVGRATPGEAYETMLWAQATGNLDVYASFLTFAPRGRMHIDAFFASLPENVRLQLGSPEKMIAVLNPSHTYVAAFQLIGQTEHGMKVAVHVWTRAYNGRERITDMLFQRFEDGWYATPFSEETTVAIVASLDPQTGKRRLNAK